MDEFFLQCRSLLLQGEYAIAEEAYRKLFDILEMGEEPGHLPGDLNSTSMITVDMDEQVALFLRAVYLLNTPSEERAATLYESMHKCQYLAHEIKLKNMINALDSELPDFDDFLAEWIYFLKNEEQNQARTIVSFNRSKLLREAVFLKGGIPAISEFARQHGDKYPHAYLDWIEALGREDDTDLIIRVARDGLSRIPRDNKVRAEVAETISKVGEKQKGMELIGKYRSKYPRHTAFKNEVTLAVQNSDL